MATNETASAESVARRLVWIREYFGLNQKEFSASIGVLPSQLNNWEKGRHRLSLEGALKINAVYGTTLDFIYLDRRDDLPLAMLKALTTLPLDNNSSTSSDNPDD